MNDLTVANVGNDRFNRDHERLLFYVQEFTRLCTRFRLRTPFPDEWDQMDAIFVRLEKYTRVHFKEEERAMEGFAYPALSDHREQHQHLVNVLADLKVKIKNREFQAIGTVKQFLIEWLTHHINHTDTQYSPYLQKGHAASAVHQSH
ncbi:MAG: hemerythrin family protein [Magnetococcales bacterium]|nr:hemerythrin family protein [Magnetococcales bacterium]MBF0149991.1 hemerythrin family protein [Magnetococcales bacterium]MBF0173611.1 hemerythrin family protein [Magnetococcales bacterium]MBF0347782.1 hemerythrin family protein [Magnetococcales bacterium]MBF0631281.1 hemerythrin family protein [Magnetococcales bacterium]